MNRGEEHHAAKLSDKEVQAARILKEKYLFPISLLARICEVTFSVMWDAVNYNTWKHVRDIDMSMLEAIQILEEANSAYGKG